MAYAWNGKQGPSGLAATVPRARGNRARRIQLPSWGVKPGEVLNNRWIIGEAIGRGSFGVVHICQCSSTLECFAVKIEHRDKQRDINNRTARRERETLEALLKVEGFPSIKDYGDGEDYLWSVMTLLGATLETMLKRCRGQFSVYTAVHIGDQILARIESLHRHGFVHRDIKPENFMLGLGKFKNTVFMCDFGLSKGYLDRNNNHVAFRYNLPFIGTMRYASTQNHQGFEQGRRDDLESWWFMLVYMIVGHLPWQTIVGSDAEDKNFKVLSLKLNIPPDLEMVLPKGFMEILYYIRTLNYDELPDYYGIRNMLRESLAYDFEPPEKVRFDWEFIDHLNPNDAPSGFPHP